MMVIAHINGESAPGMVEACQVTVSTLLSRTDPGRVEDSPLLQMSFQSGRDMPPKYSIKLLVSYFYLPLHAFEEIGRKSWGISQ